MLLGGQYHRKLYENVLEDIKVYEQIESAINRSDCLYQHLFLTKVISILNELLSNADPKDIEDYLSLFTQIQEMHDKFWD